MMDDDQRSIGDLERTAMEGAAVVLEAIEALAARDARRAGIMATGIHQCLDQALHGEGPPT